MRHFSETKTSQVDVCFPVHEMTRVVLAGEMLVSLVKSVAWLTFLDHSCRSLSASFKNSNQTETAGVREKYRFCSDSNELPDSWDTILLPYALQAIRVDPASAHGYSPAQLMLGRPLFYPFELERKDVDVTGTFFTTNFS